MRLCEFGKLMHEVLHAGELTADLFRVRQHHLKLRASGAELAPEVKIERAADDQEQEEDRDHEMSHGIYLALQIGAGRHWLNLAFGSIHLKFYFPVLRQRDERHPSGEDFVIINAI